MDESAAIAEFYAAVNDMNAAFNRSAIDREALTRTGGDPTTIDLAVYKQNLEFLNRIAPLEPIARQLDATGRPQLNQALQAQKVDIEQACRIILEMAKARRLANAALMTQSFKDYEENVATLQRINDRTREPYGMKKNT